MGGGRPGLRPRYAGAEATAAPESFMGSVILTGVEARLGLGLHPERRLQGWSEGHWQHPQGRVRGDAVVRSEGLWQSWRGSPGQGKQGAAG